MDAGTDNQKIWGIINSCIFGQPIKQNTKAVVIKTSDMQCDNLVMICDILNKFFISSTKQSIICDNTISSSHLPFTPVRPNYFTFFYVNLFIIIKTINELKSKTSPGYDGITTNIIKMMLPTEADSIKRIIIFSTNTFPAELKIAKVVPIFKGGNKELPENYRPISILPTFSKIIERIMYKQIMAYFYDTNYFNQNQYGFIQNSGTLIASAALVQAIQGGIANKKNYGSTIHRPEKSI